MANFNAVIYYRIFNVFRYISNFILDSVVSRLVQTDCFIVGITSLNIRIYEVFSFVCRVSFYKIFISLFEFMVTSKKLQSKIFCILLCMENLLFEFVNLLPKNLIYKNHNIYSFSSNERIFLRMMLRNLSISIIIEVQLFMSFNVPACIESCPNLTHTLH